MLIGGGRRSKKSKHPDARPCKGRYWVLRKLERRKVKNLMRSCGMAYGVALEFWNRARKGRVKFELRGGVVPPGKGEPHVAHDGSYYMPRATLAKMGRV